jgi:ABC-type proline/glycine betaine transport system permease subunit
MDVSHPTASEGVVVTMSSIRLAVEIVLTVLIVTALVSAYGLGRYARAQLLYRRHDDGRRGPGSAARR